jgi:hypothetical protein
MAVEAIQAVANNLAACAVFATAPVIGSRARSALRFALSAVSHQALLGPADGGNGGQ